ncbi:CPBP family glutamic-type intramembrane protease [Bifidobacterium sp. ESL0798]|uniref:CPBP family intramembrane glutamic endopeptidase n=1 Tax=Bifidobacterium sp. ESL0798 TaxID=2983235 RepID=UPI0023F8ADF2|nr:CPBP family glutamic-type intramembrane protease [Bifidobacterium sp. ESL0798]WEV73819.1 CPBP family glutamic-type intramembrane protease [Bifidobacterium sp. ESL0798]
MNDDNRPEEQASHSLSQEESGSLQQSQQPQSPYHALHAKAQPKQEPLETQETRRLGQVDYSSESQDQAQASSQPNQPSQAESGSQYEPESAYRSLKSLVQPQQQSSTQPPQSQTYPQPYGEQSWAQPVQQYQTQLPVSQQYQGQPYSPQGQSYQQPQMQTYQPYQSQVGYQQSQYRPYQAQYQQPQYQQTGQYPSQPYQQPQYQAYQYPSYPLQLSGAQPQPQYQSQSQPRYRAQPFSQFARPAFTSYFHQPNPTWQAAMYGWLGEVRKRFSNIGYALDLVVLVWYALVSVIGEVTRQFVDPAKLPMWAEFLLSNGPLYAIAIPLSLLVFRTIPKVKRKTSNMGVGMFLALMAISFPLADIGNIIGNILSGLLSNDQAQSSISELLEGLDPISLLLFTVIIGPIFEEWLFRRLLIDRMQQYGEKTAILVSAFAFGLFHGNLFQFFYAFGFGLLLAYAYVRTGKLRYTIAMHMTFNFFGGFLPQMTFLAMDKSTLNAVNRNASAGIANAFATGHGAQVMPLLIFLVFRAVMFITGIVVAIVERKKLVFYRAPEELPAGTRAKTVLGNPGVIIFIVLCALLMIAALFNV